jgi:hypothetical protein
MPFFQQAWTRKACAIHKTTCKHNCIHKSLASMSCAVQDCRLTISTWVRHKKKRWNEKKKMLSVENGSFRWPSRFSGFGAILVKIQTKIRNFWMGWQPWIWDTLYSVLHTSKWNGSWTMCSPGDAWQGLDVTHLWAQTQESIPLPGYMLIWQVVLVVCRAKVKDCNTLVHARSHHHDSTMWHTFVPKWQIHHPCNYQSVIQSGRQFQCPTPSKASNQTKIWFVRLYDLGYTFTKIRSLPPAVVIRAMFTDNGQHVIVRSQWVSELKMTYFSNSKMASTISFT